jgi:hypothetical protein
MTTPTPIATTKKVELSLTLPAINFEAFMQRAAERATLLFSNIYNPISSSVNNASTQASSRARRLKFPKMNNGGFDFMQDNLISIRSTDLRTALNIAPATMNDLLKKTGVHYSPMVSGYITVSLLKT